MVLIDFTVCERKGAKDTKFKVVARLDDTLGHVVSLALQKFLAKKPQGVCDKHVSLDRDLSVSLDRVRSVSCAGSDLTDMLHEPAATVKELDTIVTPTLQGFVIELNRVQSASEASGGKAKQLKCMDDVLMSRVALELRYLKVEVEEGVEQNLQQQLTLSLYVIWLDAGVGYRDVKQKEQLIKNSLLLNNTLCYIQQHWRSFFRVGFPNIPLSDSDYASSIFLEELQELKRTASKKGR